MHNLCFLAFGIFFFFAYSVRLVHSSDGLSPEPVITYNMSSTSQSNAVISACDQDVEFTFPFKHVRSDSVSVGKTEIVSR